MNETLSQSQVTSIVVDVNSIVVACARNIEKKNDEFVSTVSEIWEDRNAVEYFKKHKRLFENIINNLNSNHRTFLDAIENIANYYSKVGNIGRVTVDRINIEPHVNVSKIQEYFTDSENSDDFGFRNPSSGASQIIDAFNQLAVDLDKIANESSSRINQTNAFGNTKVKLELSRSASKVISIVNDSIKVAKTSIQNYIDQTAKAYIKVGQDSADAMKKIQSSDDSIEVL